ncbi:unnamed protein product, partial [Heterotrigona itama]
KAYKTSKLEIQNNRNTMFMFGLTITSVQTGHLIHHYFLICLARRVAGSHSVIEYRNILSFLHTFTPSSDEFILTFDFMLCRLFLNCKDSIECIDIMIINGQFDELLWKELYSIDDLICDDSSHLLCESHAFMFLRSLNHVAGRKV